MNYVFSDKRIIENFMRHVSNTSISDFLKRILCLDMPLIEEKNILYLVLLIILFFLKFLIFFFAFLHFLVFFAFLIIFSIKEERKEVIRMIFFKLMEQITIEVF